MTQRETTLERYFQDRDTPMANRELIRSMMEQVGIERYEQLGSYLKAVRSSGGRDLQVHFGWTNGFTSEAEALAAIEGHAVAGLAQPTWLGRQSSCDRLGPRTRQGRATVRRLRVLPEMLPFNHGDRRLRLRLITRAPRHKGPKTRAA